MTSRNLCLPPRLFLLFFCLFFLLPAAASGQEWRYTVQPGDNAWDVGRRYLKSMRYWQQFKALNHIRDPRRITPGSQLRFRLDWLKSGAVMATLQTVQGPVTVWRPGSGNAIAARAGMALWAGDEIRTGPGGNASIRFADNSRVLVEQESILALDSLKDYAGTGMADTRLYLKKGRTDNRVTPKKGPGSRFEIRTPSAMAAVRGTSYRIGSDGALMRTEVSTGAVTVANELARQTVPARYGTLTGKEEKPRPPIPLLPPPDLSSLPGIMEESPFTLRFPPVPGAAGYRLQVAVSRDFDTLLADTVSDQPRIVVPQLADGDYVLRLRAIDAHGLEGLDAYHRCTLNARPLPPIRVRPGEGAVLTDPRPTFLWSAPELARRYIFQLADNRTFTNPLIDLQEYGKTTFRPAKKLAPGTYYWRVAGRDADGRPGPMGLTMSFRIPVPAPDMGQSEFDPREMVFRWKPVGPQQRYHIQIATDKDFGHLIVDRQTGKARFKMTALDPGDYYIRVATIEPDDFQGPFSSPQHLKVPSPPNPWALILGPLFFLGVAL